MKSLFDQLVRSTGVDPDLMNEARDDEYTTQLDEFEAALKNLLKEQHVDIVKIDSEEYELDEELTAFKVFVKNGEAVTVATLLKIIQLSVKWPYNGNSDETTVYVQNKGTNLIIKGILCKD